LALSDFHNGWNNVDGSPGELSKWEQDVVRDKDGNPPPIGDPQIPIDGIVQTSKISGTGISSISTPSIDEEPGTILLAGTRATIFTINQSFSDFKASIRLYSGPLGDDPIIDGPNPHDKTIGIVFRYTKDETTGF
jgi:hypothetical protein